MWNIPTYVMKPGFFRLQPTDPIFHARPSSELYGSYTDYIGHYGTCICVYIYMCVTYISNISIVTVIVAYNYLGLHHWNSLDVINQFNTIHFPSEARFCQASQSSPAWKVFWVSFAPRNPPESRHWTSSWPRGERKTPWKITKMGWRKSCTS